MSESGYNRTLQIPEVNPRCSPVAKSNSVRVSFGSSHEPTFAGVEIPSAQGLESTQIGHSGSLMRTSAIGSQSSRPMAAMG